MNRGVLRSLALPTRLHRTPGPRKKRRPGLRRTGRLGIRPRYWARKVGDSQPLRGAPTAETKVSLLAHKSLYRSKKKTFLLKIERVSRWDLCSSLAFCQRRRRLDVGSSTLECEAVTPALERGKAPQKRSVRAWPWLPSLSDALAALFCKGKQVLRPPARDRRRSDRPAADGRLPALRRRCRQRCAAFREVLWTQVLGPRGAGPRSAPPPRLLRCRSLLCSSLAFGLRSRRLVGSWALGLCFATAKDKRQKLQHRQSAVFFFAVAFTAP